MDRHEDGLLLERPALQVGHAAGLARLRRLGSNQKMRYGCMPCTPRASGTGARSTAVWLRHGYVDGLARAYNVLWKSLFGLKLFEHSDQISAAWIGTRIKRVALSRRSLMQETMGYLEGGSATLLTRYGALHSNAAAAYTSSRASTGSTWPMVASAVSSSTAQEQPFDRRRSPPRLSSTCRAGARPARRIRRAHQRDQEHSRRLRDPQAPAAA